MLIGATVGQPRLLAEVADVEAVDADGPAPPALEYVNGVPVIATEARPGEKILYVLRTKGPATVETLALAAYGQSTRGGSREAKNVDQNTRKLLERMRRDGLVERDALRLWHLVPTAPG